MLNICYLGLQTLLKNPPPQKKPLDINKYLMFVVSERPRQTVTYVTSTQGTVEQSAIGSCSNPLYTENNQVY